MTQAKYRYFKQKIDEILWRLDCRDEVQPEFYLTPEQVTDELLKLIQEAMHDGGVIVADAVEAGVRARLEIAPDRYVRNAAMVDARTAADEMKPKV